ncbi:hypothetical protein [Paraburkholderia sp. J94]|uniref:hypothetical protein n=1 Tax=Paraburkholderia sp. J94 TaxID=2805441 RepID=UPI002AB20FA0|nr:hypothetical protein [Paraburkholderia sp. J94]
MNGKTRALTAFPHLGRLAALAPIVPLAGALLLSGCVADTRVAATPARPVAVVAPPPAPVVVAAPVYVPEPHDAYVSIAADRDVVYASGATYIWFVGSDGHRHRHYYGRGDLRGEVMHRRAELRNVMAHHDGHLPMQTAFVPPPPTRGGPPVHRVRVEMTPRARPMARQAAYQPHPPAHGPQHAEHRPNAPAQPNRNASHHAPAQNRQAGDHGHRPQNGHPGNPPPMASAQRPAA